MTTTAPSTPLDATRTARPMLKVEGLTIEYPGRPGQNAVRAVDGVSFGLGEGEILGIVGESGSGKTTVGLALLGLTETSGGVVRGGRIEIAGQDILSVSPRERASMRGGVVSMVFQDPMSSFNPLWPVGFQLMETIRSHDRSLSKQAARKKALELFDRVSMPNVQMEALPNQLSGGMLQRAMIAVAIANEPRLIVADEPATALDVTVQAQILQLFREVLAHTSAGLIVVTHDLGVVAELADHVLVMYGGKGVEVADVNSAFHEPRHPYTGALLTSRPRLDLAVGGRERLPVIPGAPATPANLPSGCSFHPRCALMQGRDRCVTDVPALVAVSGTQASACHFHEEMKRHPSA